MQKHTIHTVAATVALTLIGFGAAVHVAPIQTQTPPKTTPAAKPAAPAAPAGMTFATPEEAMAAAVKAAGTGAEALLALLGPDAKDLVYSSDAVADQKERADFVKYATEKTKLAKDPADANRVTVLIGNEKFPTAIPRVHKNGRWLWDAVE